MHLLARQTCHVQIIKARTKTPVFLGHRLAEKIDCFSVIACNYNVDVNKFVGSDYTMQIAHWNPRVLIEIHGHGGNKANSDIEISSGSLNKNDFSKTLADRLKTLLLTSKELKDITICGEYDKLHFQASSTITISGCRWLSYHIELPPKLRKVSDNSSGEPPPIGYQFCDALAKVLMEIHGVGS